MPNGLQPDDPIVQLQEARKQRQAAPKADPNGHAPRPTIRITAGELARVVDQVEGALGEHSANLYSYGNKLVQIVTGEIRTTEGKEKSLRLALITPHNLLYQISMAAKFEKYNPKIEQWVMADCPRQVAETYIALGQWRMPTLLGVVTCPTLRPDGSLLVTPRYDEQTGLFFDPGGVLLPPVPGAADKSTSGSGARGTRCADREVQIHQRAEPRRRAIGLHDGCDTARAGYRPYALL
jgi:putative DNA primase/helicase